ncbi:n19m, NADH-ubiquinone oxidoreductase 9.5 kDa subunit [Pestalotiopsis sp. IQ-011]
MDLFICIPLILVAFKCVDAINEYTPASQLQELRSTLILVAKGLSSQRRNHYLSEALFRVIRGRMGAQEASILKGVLSLDDKGPREKKRAPMQTVRSAWTVSVVKEDTQVLNNLVENYAHLNLDDQTDLSLKRLDLFQVAVDPLVCLATSSTCFWGPDLGLTAVVPAAVSTRNPYQDFLFHQTGALHLLLAVVLAVLLRHSAADLAAWRIVQAAVLAVDLILLGSQYYSQRQEDFAAAAITVFVAVLRSCFLLGIGFKSLRAHTKVN